MEDKLIKSVAKPKVIYIIGLAYSGTTLFSLALGTIKGVVNLGEVSSLENDYRDYNPCSCGARLDQCDFWKSVKTELQSSYERHQGSEHMLLKDDSRAAYIDRRGRTFRENIQLVLGRSALSIYGDHLISAYREMNESFFRAVSKSIPENEFIVDCSKSSERFEALAGSDQLDLRCIHLQRSMWSIAASKLKRNIARGPISGFVNTTKYLLWLRARQRRVLKQYQRHPSTKRLRVDWETFVAQPNKELNRITEFLGLESASFSNTDTFALDPSIQHVFVGNRWLFRERAAAIQLEQRNDCDQLSVLQKSLARLILGKKPSISEL